MSRIASCEGEESARGDLTLRLPSDKQAVNSGRRGGLHLAKSRCLHTWPSIQKPEALSQMDGWGKRGQVKTGFGVTSDYNPSENVPP